MVCMTTANDPVAMLTKGAVAGTLRGGVLFLWPMIAMAICPDSAIADTTCEFPVENVSFARIEVPGTYVRTRQFLVESGVLQLTISGQQARSRLVVTRPFKFVTTPSAPWASLALRPTEMFAGILSVQARGAAQVARIRGRRMDVQVGFQTLRNLPFDCAQLEVTSDYPKFSFSQGQGAIGNRLYTEPGGEFRIVDFGGDLLVVERSGSWTKVQHYYPGLFSVTGWIQTNRLRVVTNPGSNLVPARNTTVCFEDVPTRVGRAKVPPGTMVYKMKRLEGELFSLDSSGWVYLAEYEGGRIALAGVQGWRWESDYCPMGWLPPVKPIWQ